MTTQFTLDYDTHLDLKDLLEDTASFACDEYNISAELFYLCMETFAQAKIHQLKTLKNSLDK